MNWDKIMKVWGWIIIGITFYFAFIKIYDWFNALGGFQLLNPYGWLWILLVTGITLLATTPLIYFLVKNKKK